MSTLAELAQLLDIGPVIAKTHPVSLAYLSDVTVYPTLEALALACDAPEPQAPGRALTLDTDRRYAHRFSTIVCDHDPFTLALNQVLFPRYDFVAAHMLTQRTMADRVVSEAAGVNVIALLLNYDFPGNVRELENIIERGVALTNGTTALRLARYFNTSAEFWTNLQAAFDLKVASSTLGKKIEKEIEPLVA